MRTFNFQLVTALFVFIALGWTSGGQSARSAGGESGALSGADFGPQPQLAELIPVASARAPLSRGGDIALPGEGTACVIDSYDYRIHCIPRDGGRAAVFGRRGQGPGEFPSEDINLAEERWQNRHLDVDVQTGNIVWERTFPEAMAVDRPLGPSDPDGYPDRGIDWYDIGELSFGLSPGNPEPAGAEAARPASGR